MTEMIIAQAPLRVDPPHWYTGLKNHELQLIFHADGIQTSQVTLADNGLAKIKYISKLRNKNYLV
ncbi:MAG: cyclomaltodextrinase N-terminal domain-containing protein, partial [Flavobacteriales bacterium]